MLIIIIYSPICTIMQQYKHTIVTYSMTLNHVNRLSLLYNWYCHHNLILQINMKSKFQSTLGKHYNSIREAEVHYAQ